MLRLLLAVVFLSAAALKAARPGPFRSVIDALIAADVNLPGPIEPHLILPVAVAVITWEAFLGLALLAGLWTRRVAWLTAATLGVFTLVLIRLLFLPDTPGCGCLGGMPTSVADARTDASLGIVRNIALAWVAAWVARRTAARAFPASSPTPPSVGTMAPASSRGFTLIETIAAIAIIAVLIAILLPALSKTKLSAEYVRSLSSQRQLLALISMYGNERNEYYPYVAVPMLPDLGIPSLADQVSGKHPGYFANSRFWTEAFESHVQQSLSGIASTRNLDGTLAVREKYGRPDLVITYFLLSHATSAAPAYWVGEFPPDDLSLYRAMRSTDTRYPSAKGLLVDLNEDVFNAETADDRWSVGMADGSAAVRPRRLIGHENLQRPYGAIFWPVLTTPEGLHGRDY